MVFDTSPEQLIKEIGHDGLEVWWPEFTDDRRYRSHNMEEIIDCAFLRKKSLTPISAMPMQAPRDGMPRPTYAFPLRRYERYIHMRLAILIGETRNGNGHAWAWNGFNVFDPRGFKGSDASGSIQTAWILNE
jgi:hypothetical protein